MKLLPLLLLLSFRLSAQTKLKLPASSKDSVTPVTFTVRTGPIGIGTSDSLASVTFWDNGTVSVSGDSLAAIKMLWRRLNEANERESKLWRQYGKSQQALIKLANDWKKANEQLKKELEKIKPKQ